MELPNIRGREVIVVHRFYVNFRVLTTKKLMSIVLNRLEEFALAYINYKLAFSKATVECFCHLQMKSDQLMKHGLKLKLQKCQFLKDEIKYLVFVVNKNELKSYKDKF